MWLFLYNILLNDTVLGKPGTDPVLDTGATKQIRQ